MKLSALWPWGDSDGGWDDDEDPEPLHHLIPALIILLALCFGGCKSSPFLTPPKPQNVLSMCDYGPYNIGDPQWFTVIKARCDREHLPPPIVVSSHGNIGYACGVLSNDWFLIFHAPIRVIPARLVAITLHTIYPNNSIWLCCCNPGRTVINIPNVYIPLGSVHCIPDAFAFGAHETRRDFGHVGSAEEFICPSRPYRARLAGER